MQHGVDRDRSRESARIGGSLPVTAIIVAGCVAMSCGNLTTKLLLPRVPALQMAFLQLLFGAAAVWLAAAVLGRMPRRDGLKLALPGLLQPGLVYVFSFLGLAMSPVSLQGFLFAFEAVIVAALAWPLLGERVTRGVVAASLVGTAGVLLLSTSHWQGVGPSPAGALLLLAAVICAALDTIVCRALAIASDPLTMTAAAVAAGLAAVTPLVLLTGPHRWAFLGDWRTMAGVAVAGVLLVGVGPVLLNSALSRISASRAAAMFPLTSVLTAIGGAAFLGERLGRGQVAGGALIVFAALALAYASQSGEHRDADGRG